MNKSDLKGDLERKGQAELPKAGWWCLVWLIASIGALTLAVLWASSTMYLIGWMLAIPFGFVACWAIGVIAHEFGHLITARLLSLNPFSIVIGAGPTVWQGRMFGLEWTVKALPSVGFVRVWPVPGPLLRLRMLLMVGAGPAVNGVFECVLGYLIWVPPHWLAPGGTGYYEYPFVVASFLVNGWLFIGSLIPRQGRIQGATYPNDGLLLLRLLTGSHPALAMFPNDGQRHSSAKSGQNLQWSAAWQEMVDSGQALRSLAQYRELLKQKGLPADLRFMLLDAFATCVIMLGASDSVAEADQYSEELFLARPNDFSVKGTRGSVLIEKDQVEEGARFLAEVVENDPVEFDRAIAASYLALAEIKRGQREAAAVWLAKARAFDPDCVPMKRFERILSQL